MCSKQLTARSLLRRSRRTTSSMMARALTRLSFSSRSLSSSSSLLSRRRRVWGRLIFSRVLSVVGGTLCAGCVEHAEGGVGVERRDRCGAGGQAGRGCEAAVGWHAALVLTMQQLWTHPTTLRATLVHCTCRPAPVFSSWALRCSEQVWCCRDVVAASTNTAPDALRRSAPPHAQPRT